MSKKLTKNVREKMLGLLPFDVDSQDRFTPMQYEKVDKDKDLIIPKEYHPIFCLSPFNEKEKNECQVLSEKHAKAKNSKDKRECNNKINDLVRLKINDIENLWDLGKEDYTDCEKDTENNCISTNMWKRIPVIIQNAIYFQLSNISGLTTNEMLGL